LTIISEADKPAWSAIGFLLLFCGFAKKFKMQDSSLGCENSLRWIFVCGYYARERRNRPWWGLPAAISAAMYPVHLGRFFNGVAIVWNAT
jgi:hypothetical protein